MKAGRLVYMYIEINALPFMTAFSLTLLHSERPKLHRVLAFLSAIGLSYTKTLCCYSNRAVAWGMCHRVLRGGGSKLGSKFSPWGSLCERTPLGKVVGNLAQAKTGSTQDPFVLKSSVMI